MASLKSECQPKGTRKKWPCEWVNEALNAQAEKKMCSMTNGLFISGNHC